MPDPTPQQAALTPEVLLQMNFSLAASRVLTTAVQLGVFASVAQGHATVSDIATATATSERGMAALLNALVVFELLTKTNNTYNLAPLAAEFLVPDQPNYIGEIMADDWMWQSWAKLPEVVRTGTSAVHVEQQAKAEQFFPGLVSGLHILNREPARRVAEILGAGVTYQGLQVVDIGCGSAVWSIAIAEADPQAQVTAQDFPGMLAETQKYLQRHQLSDRYSFLPGDLKQVDFGENQYDLALLGNIIHSEGVESSRNLFRRLHTALKPGGRVAIIDMIPTDDRTGPAYPVIFALNMLLNTTEGGTYTLTEYTEWLTAAGFERVETADIGSHSPLIIGHKPQ